MTEYVQFLLTSGGCNGTGLSANTIFGILSVLKSIFFIASAEKQISVENITKLPIKQGSTKMVLLSADEQSVLSEYLTQNLNPRDIGILLSLFAGLRLGEVCALRWSDISNSTIIVHSSMQRIQTFDSSGKKTKIVISTPKSNCSVCSIPIPKHLSEIVECSRGEAESFVISNSKSNIVEPRSMENYYKGVLKKCGLKPTNYHALRHTFATRCIELGFDVKSLSEILGHSNVNITMNRYVHPSMELKQKNMNMLCVFLPMSHTT